MLDTYWLARNGAASRQYKATKRQCRSASSSSQSDTIVAFLGIAHMPYVFTVMAYSDIRLKLHYILGTNMMCAFGVPANMIHGAPTTGFSVSPVVAAVAYGM